MYSRTLHESLRLFLLVALAVATNNALLAQDRWTPSRPPIAKRLETFQQLQVDAHRPGGNNTLAATPISQKPEPEIAKVELASYNELGFDTRTFDEAPYQDIDPINCNCPDCNPIAHLGCTVPGCGCGGPLPGRGVWVGADYLLWSLQGMDLPPLVTTSPVGTAPADTGVLGLSTTNTLVSGTVGEELRSGGRITAGVWLDPSRETSWEASYLATATSADDFTFTNSLTPNLAIPIFDTELGQEASLLVAQSTFLTGMIGVETASELQSFEILRRKHWSSDGIFNFDLLLGFKHGSLDDTLRVNQTSRYSISQGPILAGSTISRFDHFESRNDFNGFLLGLERRHRWNGWLVGYTGKLSLGSNRSEVQIDGQTLTTVPNAGSSRFTGGLLAQATNMGVFTQQEFMVLPEFEIMMRRQFTNHIRLHCGYSVMYWNSVMRASDAINRRMSQYPPEAITGTADPKFIWNNSGFLAHGLQFGVDYRF